MPVRNETDWLTATIGGEVVLMNVKGQEYIGLDEVGADIWDVLKTPHSLNDICGEVARLYRIAPDTCRSDVNRVVDMLMQQGAAIDER